MCQGEIRLHFKLWSLWNLAPAGERLQQSEGEFLRWYPRPLPRGNAENAPHRALLHPGCVSQGLCRRDRRKCNLWSSQPPSEDPNGILGGPWRYGIPETPGQGEVDPCHLLLAVCAGASCGKAWRDKAWGSTTMGHVDSRAAWPSSGSFLLWALRLLLSTCCAQSLQGTEPQEEA